MSQPFPKWRAQALPDLAEARARRAGARALPIAHEGAEHGEALVSLSDFGIAGRNHYAHARNPPYFAPAPGAVDGLYLRAGVAARLARVNAALGAEGLALHVWDGWRPRAVQAYFHDEWTPRALMARRPELTGAALAAEVARYWAAPSASAERPAPHATGGAVDLTLTWAGGEPLFMGSIFDDATALAHTDWFEGPRGDESFSAEEARANRRILYWAMARAGFVNHPEEWWHYSWGDQAWAAHIGADAALYGLAAAPA